MTRWVGRATRPIAERLVRSTGFHGADSPYARSQLATLSRAIEQKRESYILGLGVGGHNAGAALVRIRTDGCIELVCNEEEERYTAVKHFAGYPEHSIAAARGRMEELGVEPGDLAASVIGWDYARSLVNCVLNPMMEEAPASATGKLSKQIPPGLITEDKLILHRASKRLPAQLGLSGRMPVVATRHHDAHAFFSYGVSPFAGDSEPVMVLVVDGSGDDASMSFYEARDGRLELKWARWPTQLDSLGSLYSFLSSSQGGWPMLSSEGRYMGAAAWGDGNRLTNPYYRRLKNIVHLGGDGEVRVNRILANWVRDGWAKPYSDELIDILGEPIPLERMWNPDAVLSVDDIHHSEITLERVDKAAAVQMVFEDALTHIVEHIIRTTRSHRLVMTGGTALNCVANMRLLECFDDRWYERNLAMTDTRLHVWVPPIPGDAGIPLGAAYAFAMRAGARPGPPLRHAFHCGLPTKTDAIRAAVIAESGAASMPLGDCSDHAQLERVTDLLAHLLADGCIVGLYQGASETGPRALGHRSILANPCDPDTRRLLNERVKHRELIRPLAPMLTQAAAERFFELSVGASDDDYNAYTYMVLTAHARPIASELIPAVVHRDGTGRLQIVRPDVDPFCHALLLAMGRRLGVEVVVNTSLNVGAPIAHTPEQALTTLKRARGMEGLLMIGDDRQAMLVWLEERSETRARLMKSLDHWSAQTGHALAGADLSSIAAG